VKSGILTASVEYKPSALFSALSHAQDRSLPCRVELCLKKPFGELIGTLTHAQISIAIHAAGTITAFTVKSQRIFSGGTSMKGNYEGG
jgi:hypothetical protein